MAFSLSFRAYSIVGTGDFSLADDF